MADHKRPTPTANSCDDDSCDCRKPGDFQRREFVQMLGLGSAALASTLVPGAALATAGNGEDRGANATAPRAQVGTRKYNEEYRGEFLDRIAFPLGGIGAGMICIEGSGALSHVSLRHHMNVFNEPNTFAAICVKGKTKEENIAKVVEGPVPSWKLFGRPGAANGLGQTDFGLPRFQECSFLTQFPFSTVKLSDEELPLECEITGWSPFTPGDSDNSSLPVAGVEYTFKNTSSQGVEAVFSFHSANFMSLRGGGDTVRKHQNGFLLWQAGSEDNPQREGGCAISVDNDQVVVDHCWFRGAWFDSLTMVWENIRNGRLLDNPPVGGSCPGASLYVPLKLAPGESKTVRLRIAWYVPNTSLRIGSSVAGVDPAFGDRPSRGTGSGQNEVTGFLGEGLVNTYDPHGDGAVGTLTSPPFKIERDFLQLLVGGGNQPDTACVNLLVEGKVVHTATGSNREWLRRTVWDTKALRGKEAVIQIVDTATGGWGHINVDHIVQTDSPSDKLSELGDAIVVADFEGGDYGDWKAAGPDGSDLAPKHYNPWYAERFAGVEEVAKYWEEKYDDLKDASERFRDAFYDTTLPGEVIEAVAANLTILKTPTVLRQHDGRIWAWEGCFDTSGCCHGSCTHVWNYAQAMPHLFPDLERTLRETEFNDNQDDEGHQTFRAALPIRPVSHGYYAAADGQLGGIMKMYREWQISGDTDWLRRLWPKVRQSLDYCIKTWDPRKTGALEEPHHNTYDIEYWGPDGHCGSFYLGALAAAAQMGKALGEEVSEYETLLERGQKYMVEQLFNGEYFFHDIRTEGLDAKFQPIPPTANGEGYREAVAALNRQGPKYQYGNGCLSDGVLGFWMALVCGVGKIGDEEKIASNLRSIHKYNFKSDLSDHANPQRPTYAAGTEGGLLLCTWPKGDELSIPFVYSNEVWTGIEYQVASHLIFEGMVEEGLEIVRACRDRYDGRVRNPFDEYECGHWYARAMSSYGLLQGLTGVRYSALDKTLHIDSKVGNSFKTFLSTAGGFATVGLENGQPFIKVRHGEIPVEKCLVSGEEKSLKQA